MMTTDRHCAQCGAPLASLNHDASCPACLLEAGLHPTGDGSRTPAADDSPHPVAASNSPGSLTGAGISFVRHFGNYELLDEIARGGMGVVYRARQKDLDRLVAVKMLLSGPLAGPALVQRFRTEAATAASLQHPNIVAIHEVGFCEGQHFIAMDYVPGHSLADLARDGPLEPRRAAAYVEKIARAIHFAHERKILHRDLKPSNVLVDPSDTPRVTDFGLAKRLEADSDLTQSGQVLGSPAYMPPEQVEAHRSKLDQRSDVYSLGAILFHLLTGRAPFVADSIPAMLHAVLHSDPVSPRLLMPGLSPDLETICLKCLEKEPDRRYPTAQTLAEELARFLRDEPILARPAAAPERLWRWARRKPALASLIVLLHVVGVTGLAGIVWQWWRAEENAIEAQAQRDVAEGRLYAAQMREAHAEYAIGNQGGALALLRAWPPTPGRSDWRGFEWHWLHRLCQANLGGILATNASGFSAIAVSANGQVVALGTGDGNVQLVDARDGTPLDFWQAHPGGIDSLAFTGPATHWLATLGGDDGQLKLWDTTRTRPVVATNCSRRFVAQLAASPSGRWLAAGAPNEPRVNVWQVSPQADGRPGLSLHRVVDGLGPAAFAPDEQALAVANYGGFGGLALYDLVNDTIEALNPGHANLIGAVAFSADGQWLASGSSDESVAVWNVPRRHREHTLRRAAMFNVTALSFSVDSRVLFAATTDQNIHGWRIADPDLELVLPGHASRVSALAVSHHGNTLFSAGHDGTARRWLLNEQVLATTLARQAASEILEDGPAPALGLSVAPDQQTVAVSHYSTVSLLDLGGRRPVRSVESARAFGQPNVGVHAVAFSTDGTHLGLGSSRGWLTLLDTTTLQPVRSPLQAHGDEITHLAFADGGRVLVSGGRFGGGVQLTDVATWRSITNIDVGGFHPRPAFAVSADGTRLVTGSPDQAICLWDIASGRLLAKCPQRVRSLHAAAFAPDNSLVALGDESGALYLWDTGNRQSVRRLQGHQAVIMSLAFAPDGRTLASASADHTVRLWHPDIDEEVAVLTDHGHWVFQVAFAATGQALLSCDHAGMVRVWRASD